MVDRDDLEKAHAASEAKSKSPGSASTTATGDALRRYLAAEHYRRRHESDAGGDQAHSATGEDQED